MEKKVEVATISGDFDDSRSSYSVESPPPAYHKPDMPTVKVAKIIAATILAVAFLVAISAVAIVYIQHSLKCASIVQEAATVSALVGDAIEDAGTTDDESKPLKVIQASGDDVTEASDIFSDKKKLNFPIHIDMDDITGRMMEKNQKARLNCFIEKKRTEEIIPRSSKTLQTPFGNLTTDPKFTHVTGETLSLTCRSGNEKVSKPSETPSTQATPILIQIPLQRRPQNPFAPPPIMQQEQRIPISFFGPLGPFGQPQVTRPEQELQQSQERVRQQPPPALQQLLHAMLEPLRVPLRQIALPGMNSMPPQMRDQEQRLPQNGEEEQQEQLQPEHREQQEEEEESDESRPGVQKQSNEEDQSKAEMPGIHRIPLRIFPPQHRMQPQQPQQQPPHMQQQQQQQQPQGPPHDMQMHHQQGPRGPQGRDEPIAFESQQRHDMPPFLQPEERMMQMPIFVPNHNVQPRSPGGPEGHRMKRMTGTGSCSCLCE